VCISYSRNNFLSIGYRIIQGLAFYLSLRVAILQIIYKSIMSDLRLNLGCGAKHLEGYINVDKFGNPDIRLDLETFHWPWEDNSAIEIELSHVLEHLGQQTEVYLKIIQEIYRICKAGAKVHVRVPQHRHDDLLHDPTHMRAITWFEHFFPKTEPRVASKRRCDYATGSISGC